MASSLAALSSLRRMPRQGLDGVLVMQRQTTSAPRWRRTACHATPRPHTRSGQLVRLFLPRTPPLVPPSPAAPTTLTRSGSWPTPGSGCSGAAGSTTPLRPSQPRSRPQADRDDRFCGVRLTQRVSQHGTDGRHRNREPASNQSRFSIQPSAPPIPHESRRSAAAVARTGSDNPAPDRGRGRRSQDGALRKAARR